MDDKNNVPVESSEPAVPAPEVIAPQTDQTPAQPPLETVPTIVAPPTARRPKRVLVKFGVAGVIVTSVIVLAVVGAAAFVGWRVGYQVGEQDEHDASSFCGGNQNCSIVQKPVIYLYPTHTTEVNVHVAYPAGFTQTDPVYNPKSGWQVRAQPNGLLTNLVDDKQYPYLFWEGNTPDVNFDMTKGFVVPGNQTEAFLHTKLAEIGLSPHEAGEFIDYWLPRMVGHKYNLIHFAGKQYSDYAKLTITPKPDAVLRVMMVFRAQDTPSKVTPQTFPTFQRQGFTAVEWGGMQLSN